MEYCEGGELYGLLTTQPTKRLKEAHMRFYVAEVRASQHPALCTMCILCIHFTASGVHTTANMWPASGVHTTVTCGQQVGSTRQQLIMAT